MDSPLQQQLDSLGSAKDEESQADENQTSESTGKTHEESEDDSDCPF